MLQVSAGGSHWSGSAVELSMSFDTLRDYQWKRLLDGLWAYAGLFGPLENRYIPGERESAKSSIRIPEPTDTFSQFGIIEFMAGVRVGIEILTTRSVFECVSLRIPLNMFANVSTDPDNDERRTIERTYYSIALQLYRLVPFDIAVIGVDRECPLLMELASDFNSRQNLLFAGNFLARDTALTRLQANPKNYKEVMPALRWCPPLGI